MDMRATRMCKLPLVVQPGPESLDRVEPKELDQRVTMCNQSACLSSLQSTDGWSRDSPPGLSATTVHRQDLQPQPGVLNVSKLKRLRWIPANSRMLLPWKHQVYIRTLGDITALSLFQHKFISSVIINSLIIVYIDYWLLIIPATLVQ